MIDALTLGVIWNRLLAIVEEQSTRIIRAGMATSLSEGGDLATSLFDRHGRLVVQSTGTPGMSHSLPAAVRGFLQRFPPETLTPGDALVTNDPWLCVGHLNDIVVATPLFIRGRLQGFSVTACHAADIGGTGFSTVARDLYDEGLQIPPLRLFKAGAVNEPVLLFIRENVRVPNQVVSDILTQASTAVTVAANVDRAMAEYSFNSLEEIADVIVTSTDAAFRRAIAEVPPGVYRDEVWADGFETPLRFAVTATVADGNIELDFAGTSPEVPQGINCVANYTRAYATHAVKATLCPEIPNNQGVFGPITLLLPDNCILNARRPAPVAGRHLTGHFAGFAVFGALAKAVPHRVIADSSGPCGGTLQLRGVHHGTAFSVLAFYAGGMGARPTKDGLATVHFPANARNTAVEILERVAPIQFLRKSFVTDSGGPGQFRGGLGQTVALRIGSSDATQCTLMFERLRHPPRGFHGGLAGAPSRCEINGVPIAEAKQVRWLQAGDIVQMTFAGGGGYYAPWCRDPRAVLKDVLEGRVSAEAARVVYRVALDLTRREVDEVGTRALRSGYEAAR